MQKREEANDVRNNERRRIYFVGKMKRFRLRFHVFQAFTAVSCGPLLPFSKHFASSVSGEQLCVCSKVDKQRTKSRNMFSQSTILSVCLFILVVEGRQSSFFPRGKETDPTMIDFRICVHKCPVRNAWCQSVGISLLSKSKPSLVRGWWEKNST